MTDRRPPKDSHPPSARGSSDTARNLTSRSSQDILRRPSQDMLRRPSQDILRSSHDTSRSSQDILRRPSQDILRSSQSSKETSQTSQDILRRPSLDILRGPSQDILRPVRPKDTTAPIDTALPPQDTSAPRTHDTTKPTLTPLIDPSKYTNANSVRSILRDPNTPGTGQNVRFFSRDAYKVISPDQSVNTEHEKLHAHEPALDVTETPFLDRLQRISPERNTSTPAAASVARHSAGSKGSSKLRKRPSAAEVFSPLKDKDENAGVSPTDSAAPDPLSLMLPASPPERSNIFDMSRDHELPPIPVGFDVPLLDTAVEWSAAEAEAEESAENERRSTMTSTPYKGKETHDDKETQQEDKATKTPRDDEPDSIFHAMEKSPKLLQPPAIVPLDRSQSFSLGQTVFFSMANASTPAHAPADISALPSVLTHKSTSSDPTDGRSSPSPFAQGNSKNRNRAMSDSVFQTLARASKPRPPEADINDESSSALVVYASSSPEPDPFRANATTYYTPQTMIPVTPPQGSAHARKASKEDDVILNLRTQLALQTELCAQYEADLGARDELVEILGKRLGALEKEGEKRKGVLRGWKKKVGELERTCRHLEEEVDLSRQESVERSVMDEASGEALRMLHRQIAGLEREKGEWGRQEEDLKGEVVRLEVLVRERGEEVASLEVALGRRNESEKALREGISEAREQMEIMGTVGGEAELRSQQASDEEREKHRAAEIAWAEERTILVARMEQEQEILQVELDSVRAELNVKEEECAMLKSELEAQWKHTESASEKIEGLEIEKESLRGDLEALEERIAGLEVEWTESENRKAELESELQEMCSAREEMEKQQDDVGIGIFLYAGIYADR